MAVVAPNCELCGAPRNNTPECQLLDEIPFDQLNYAQGNLPTTTTSPGYQKVTPIAPQAPKKSNLEIMMENFVASKTKKNKEFMNQNINNNEFMKQLANKSKLNVDSTVKLTEECSVIIQNKMPPKLKDPGSFSIPCVIGKFVIDKALCDLGASVSLMPLQISEILDLGNLKPTRMSLQLADHSVKYPIGILENVPMRIGQLYIPTDFIVMDIKEDLGIPILLGRPILATAGAIIDVKKGKLIFEVG
ncbi:uncharacterized protein LOC127101202 [Lathyrus oleraceus]|uniref:uncharacterized protein LOC127101202 n=1 Tax=Pisum sativum TaxID=3888 RepID=UPI0021CE1E62|nr:uncharacterized protein LOC127101202 [Pisum sativum]